MLKQNPKFIDFIVSNKKRIEKENLKELKAKPKQVATMIDEENIIDPNQQGTMITNIKA
jgi:hypothetical protein